MTEPKNRRQLPIKLPNGQIAYPDEVSVDKIQEIQQESSQELEEIPELDEQLQEDQQKNDFNNLDEIRQKVATLCEQIMVNPENKPAINSLLSLVQQFDKIQTTQHNKQLKQQVDTSLQIILKNIREEGPLAQLKGYYNNKLDQNYIKLLKNVFQGHQNSYQQLSNELQTDSNYYVHQKLLYLAQQILQKSKFQAQSPIFFNLFNNSTITKVQNVTPKPKAKKRQSKEQRDNLLNKYDIQFEIQENQQVFLSNLLLIVVKIIREHQKSSLLLSSFHMIKKFGHLINQEIYLDLIRTIKLFFYNWFYTNFYVDPELCNKQQNVTKQNNLQQLFKLFNEQQNQLFNLNIKKQYYLQNDVNVINNYIKNHCDTLVLFEYKQIFENFDLVLYILQIVTQIYNSDQENQLQQSNSILLFYMIANVYKINSQQRCQQAIQVFNQLLMGMNQSQHCQIIKKIGKYVFIEQFNNYVIITHKKFKIDLEEENSD